MSSYAKCDKRGNAAHAGRIYQASRDIIDTGYGGQQRQQDFTTEIANRSRNGSPSRDRLRLAAPEAEWRSRIATGGSNIAGREKGIPRAIRPSDTRRLFRQQCPIEWLGRA